MKVVLLIFVGSSACAFTQHGRSFGFGIIGPAMVVVVDHELGHPAIDSEILPGDEAGCVAAEETDHLYDIIRHTDTADGMLQEIRSFIVRLIVFLFMEGTRVDPTRADGIDPGFPGQ